jgi:hypothetical protein
MTKMTASIAAAILPLFRVILNPRKLASGMSVKAPTQNGIQYRQLDNHSSKPRTGPDRVDGRADSENEATETWIVIVTS